MSALLFPGALRVPAAKEKTILACFLGTRGVPEGLVTLQAGRVPSYAFPEAAAIALSRAVDYGNWKRLPEPVFPEFPVEKDRAAKVISGAREKAISPLWLDASGVRDVLGAYGIRMPQTASAKTADDAARLAKQFGVPVAVKLESRTLTHKTEIGDRHRCGIPKSKRRISPQVYRKPCKMRATQRMKRSGCVRAMPAGQAILTLARTSPKRALRACLEVLAQHRHTYRQGPESVVTVFSKSKCFNAQTCWHFLKQLERRVVSSSR